LIGRSASSHIRLGARRFGHPGARAPGGFAARSPLVATSVVWKDARTMDLQVRSEAHGEWQVVVVSGELDAETVPTLADHLEETQLKQVVVDLTELSFMDSTGLALMVDWHRRLDAGGGQFRLASPRPAVHKLFRLTDLTGVLRIHETVQHATSDPR
jgi:anti-sigma B factor antagonist